MATTQVSAGNRFRLFANLMLVGAMAIVTATPREAWAGFAIVKTMTSFQYELQCLRTTKHSVAVCYAESLIYDPQAQGVTGFSFAVQYDPSVARFDPAHSGPLGVFSVGGDSPPPNPGVGTQPVQLLPSMGFSPGAPLPGSALTYNSTSGVLTVSYNLAGPVTVNGDINFFRTDFTFLHPLEINLSDSTVTYMSSGPGSDFSMMSYSCTTQGQNPMCGSDTPSTGITTSFDTVPEPGTLAMLGTGMVGLQAFLRRRMCSRS
jgi:hypothetical protein